MEFTTIKMATTAILPY